MPLERFDGASMPGDGNLKGYLLVWQQVLPTLVRDGTPLQMQLRTALVDAILDGRLNPGVRLPSGRELATLVGVSRNTAVLVYERLVADGFLEARLRDGFYIRENITRESVRPVRTPELLGTPDWRKRLAADTARPRWLDRPAGWQSMRYPFVFGQFDTSLFPLSEWRECSRQALEVMAVRNWGQDGETDAAAQLVDQLIRRVLPRRGIVATADQVVLTMGTQHGLYLLSSLFGHAEAVFGIENPGYMDARNIFERNGTRLAPLDVDEEGLSPGGASASCDYIYCTPSHQCPTGVTMSTARRLALLAQAALHDQVIIEDDYDPETQYVGEPLPALKAIDQCERVVYVSSLSKLLAPGLRIGYIVAPAPVCERLRALRRLTIRSVPGNNQLAAALFIRLGHYDRLLQHTRKSLHERALAVTTALRRYFPDASFNAPTGGASVWLALPSGLDAAALRKACQSQGVLLDPGDPFFFEPMQRPYVRLGFSSIPLAHIEPGIRLIAKIARSLPRTAGWQRNAGSRPA